VTTYALVGGGWLGGWCWQPVARRSRDNGHDAYPVTAWSKAIRTLLAPRVLPAGSIATANRYSQLCSLKERGHGQQFGFVW